MIHFSKIHKLNLFIIFVTLLALTASIAVFKVKPSIDFTGGALVEFQADTELDEQTIAAILSDYGLENFSLQEAEKQSFIIRTVSLSQETVNSLKNTLSEKTGQTIIERKFETVGPLLGKELVTKTILAIIISILVILAYIAWSFKNVKFGIAAVFALIHDLVVLLGSFSLLGHFLGVEVDALFVTAVLTTTSFSVHDTIVVFHRLRELRKKHPEADIKNLSDQALTETIVRSVNNSLTIIFMLASLILFGGENLRWFAAALLIGTLTGTYSSPFVAVPVLISLNSPKLLKLLKRLKSFH